MCGFCGILALGGPAPDPAEIAAMTETIRHRGPDGCGVWLEGPAALGHRRLAVIDLSEGGRQPMLSNDGRRILVFNGEIYNYRELRRELEAEGVTFRSQSDTEVLLEGLGRWGTGVVRRLRGMFAFAEYDRERKRLRLGRDRLGVKPLYYFQEPGRIVFGSEIKAILAAAGVERRANPDALAEYLWFGNPTGESTAFDGIRRLAPGTVLEVGPDGTRTETFWSVDEVAPADLDWDTAVAETRRRLASAVESHLVSDVPVGVFLSGGIDSSALTALAAPRVSGPLRTFSVGFDDRRHADETGAARRVAERFGAEHREVLVSGRASRDVIPRLVRAHDEPFGDAANIPLYLLAEQLQGEIKVVLQGDGGDEMFGGYRRYRILAHARGWQLAGRAAAPVLALVDRSERTRRAVRFSRAVGAPDPGTRMALLLTTDTEAEPPTALLGPEFRRVAAGSAPFADYHRAARRFDGADPADMMLRTDLTIQLPNTFLEKVDKATMAHGLEVRVPFLDPELVEFAVGLPSRYKVDRSGGKRVLKAALRGTVPDWVLDAPKTGFGVPYDGWLRGPLTDYWREIVLDSSTARGGLVDQAVAARWLDDHLARRRNCGFGLWKALHLALWGREYLTA
ncbi:MAG: asparagine synthase (glutamine-hydrolyzing) [Gemmatimonadales bacterium]